MKLSFMCIGLAVMLLGCTNDPLPLDEDEETSEKNSTEKFSDFFDDDDSGGISCSAYQSNTSMTVMGVEFMMDVPVMCDPRPWHLIDKGDPPPDRLNPVNDRSQYENPNDRSYLNSSNHQEQDTSNSI